MLFVIVFIEVEGVVVGDSGFVFLIIFAGQACVSFDVLNEFRSQNIERIFAEPAVFRQIGFCGDFAEVSCIIYRRGKSAPSSAADSGVFVSENLFIRFSP